MCSGIKFPGSIFSVPRNDKITAISEFSLIIWQAPYSATPQHTYDALYQ